MVVDFYYQPLSAPCRAVLMTASALGLKLNLKLLDPIKGEHLKPDFVHLTPQHCVPTIVDDGFALCEGRAILCYLADQYGKDHDSLYPKDPKKRARVNHMLYFDACTVYQKFLEYYVPILYRGAEPDPDKAKKFGDALATLDKYMEGNTWATGEHITVADHSLIATISSAEIFGYDITKYPNVSRWLANAKKSIPNYDELNHAGCVEYKKVLDAKVILDF